MDATGCWVSPPFALHILNYAAVAGSTTYFQRADHQHPHPAPFPQAGGELNFKTVATDIAAGWVER